LLVRLRLAHTLWLVGDPDGSEHQHDLAVAAADESTHVYSRAVLSVWAAILALDRCDVDQLHRQVQALEADMSDDVPDHFWLMAGAFAGHLDVLEGRVEQGLTRVRQVREQLIAGEARAPGQPGITTRILLEDYALAGEAQTGLCLADEALSMGRGAELWEPEIRRLRAILLGALGRSEAEIQAELVRGLEAARQRGACTFEQRIRGTLAERPLSHYRAI
jgi:hypothetical protein